MSPAASIVIPCFDRRDSLIRLLDSLNHQTVPDNTFEVIIGDDSAELDTAREALTTVKTQFPTTVVRTGLPYTVNGVSVARNMAIKSAEAPIIICIDDDCQPNRFFVEEHLRFHKPRNPLIVLGHRTEDSEKLNESQPVSITEKKSISELMGGAASLLNFNHFMTGNISFPKRIAFQAGLFNEDFAQPDEHGWEDIEFGYRLWKLGYRIVFARDALVYRPPTEKGKDRKRSETKATQKAYGRFIKIQPLIPLVNQFLQALAQRKISSAKDLAVQLLTKDPANHGILRHLADLLLQEEDLDSALACLESALAINPYHPLVYEKIGEITLRKADYSQTLKNLSCALELDPLRTKSLYFMALLRVKLADEGNALPPSPGLNIELGGGMFPTKIRGEDQDDFISVDIFNWPTVDVVADLKNPLPFPNGCAANIFSREVLEHLPDNVLPDVIQECFRVLQPAGRLYVCCPDFEAIMSLYDKRCRCVVHGFADPECDRCKGRALVSENYWRANLLGNQIDYGDGGINDTHKNQITYPHLEGLLKNTGFVNIQRDFANKFYERHKTKIKLSVSCVKPPS
jgi:GT2 family glycosyltransferase